MLTINDEVCSPKGDVHIIISKTQGSQEEEAELSDKAAQQQHSIMVAEGLIRPHSSLKGYKQLMIAGRGRSAFLSGIVTGYCPPRNK